MTLAEATASFEAQFAKVANRVGHYAPSGEPFATITHAGPKAECDEMAWWGKSEDFVAQAWLREATDYARDRGSTLFWREPPELGIRDGLYAVWSRLSVGESP